MANINKQWLSVMKAEMAYNGASNIIINNG